MRQRALLLLLPPLTVQLLSRTPTSLRIRQSQCIPPHQRSSLGAATNKLPQSQRLQSCPLVHRASLQMMAGTSRRGHLFVMEGDARRILADAVLVPTRNLSDAVWFPNGPPAGARPVPWHKFTHQRRVHLLPGLRRDEPAIYLGWMWWEERGIAPIDWFVQAAEQFLLEANELTARRGRVLCGRALPLLSLPVIGTGTAGGREVSGMLLTALMERLDLFCASNPVDVVLVTRSPQMLSAAQAIRGSLAGSRPGKGSWSDLSPHLLREVCGSACLVAQLPALSALPVEDLFVRAAPQAKRLARLSSTGQLALFLGSGTCRSVNLPGWSKLLQERLLFSLAEIAIQAGLTHAELQQLQMLGLSDQATLLQHRLGKMELEARYRTCRREERARRTASTDQSAYDGDLECPEGSCSASIAETQEKGVAALQRLAAELLSCDHYSLLHGLLAGVPHDAAVTTNSDLCYDLACEAAGKDLTVLPYEPASNKRWLLKLHGDVHHPEDIIITYSSSTTPYGYTREALSGIVQSLLITKHILFVGFSLKDDAFNQIATSVRRSLQSLSRKHPSPAGSSPEAMLTAFESRSSHFHSRQDAQPTTASMESRSFTYKQRVQSFGSTLTLSERPFLSELWPELGCIAMGEGLAESQTDKAERWRTLEVFLDRLAFEVMMQSSEHLLDPKFIGTFSEADFELRQEVSKLLEELSKDPGCQQAPAFAVVREMLTKLGYPDEEFNFLIRSHLAQEV